MDQKEILTIISSAGASKGKAFEALACVKKGNYEEAKIKLEEARKIDVEAHNLQTQLISQSLDPEKQEVLDLLTVHAQDHYMTSQLARDLIEVLIDTFESLTKKEGK